MVNNQGIIIIHKTRYEEGKRHDYDIYKEDQPVIPKEVVTVVDLGYLGIESDFPEQKSLIPIRKKRNLERSQEEKEHYKSHSKKE